MLTFEMRKSKSLSMPVLVEGIDQGKLKFRFVIEHKGVDYGFSATQEGDNVKFVIPPLDTVVKTLDEGVYKARLEVSSIVEGDRGFFMMPWAEQIRIKKSVVVEVQQVKDDVPPVEEKKDVKVRVTKMFSEEDGVEVVEDIHEDKKANKKLRKFMD